MNRGLKTGSGFAVLLLMLGCLLWAPVVRSQGGTGRKEPGARTAPVTKPTGVPKPVPSIEGTTWQMEMIREGKSEGVNFFEFLPNGKLSVGGDEQSGTVWRQTGARVVIQVSNREGSGRFDGALSGNQLIGTMNGTNDKGVTQTARLRGKRADASALAELKYWKSIRASTNPEDFKTYLQRYPNGAFEGEARYKLSTLEQKSSPASVSPTSSPSPSTASDQAEKIFAGKDVDQRAQILSRPKPLYTEEARKNLVSGTVVLKAVLAANGQVTQIRAIQGLPNGLTEQAIAAAMQVKFTPAMKDGHPVSQWIQFEYNFSPY